MLGEIDVGGLGGVLSFMVGVNGGSICLVLLWIGCCRGDEEGGM